MRRIGNLGLCRLLALVLVVPLGAGALPAGAVEEYVEYAEDVAGLLLEQFLPSGEEVAQVSLGYAHTCAVTKAGDAYCWGRGGFGQLGDGTATDRTTPVQVVTGQGLTPGTITHVSAGYEHTCAITEGGDAYCWGRGGYGQLGDGTTTDRTTPVQVATGQGLTHGTIASISAGSSHTCALTIAGAAYCWGNNGSGQLGDGTTTHRTTPVQVATGLVLGTITHISGGNAHTCGLTIAGAAYCWGHNGYGQLGDGTTTNHTTPVQVATGQGLNHGTITHISAGGEHTCALTAAVLSIGGDAYCWGRNLSGQLGDGTTTDRTTPVRVAAGQGLTPGAITHITTGGDHTCALTTEAGTVADHAYCWGRGGGQLGDGTGNSHSTPVEVAPGQGLTPGTITSISAGGFHTCAVADSGDAYCWGYNDFGQLGNGSTSNLGAYTPVRVLMPGSPSPGAGCENDGTRVDRVSWTNGANHFEVDVHQTDDAVVTCVRAERNGEAIFARDVVVPHRSTTRPRRPG